MRSWGKGKGKRDRVRWDATNEGNIANTGEKEAITHQRSHLAI